MPVPFRFQASEFDCVPTTFVNALVYLFERGEIPPSVLQRVYLYTLDTIESRQRIGHGTSGFAIRLLANFLSEVKMGKFRLAADVYEGEAVHLGEGNPIARCLNRGGAALLRVKDEGDDWHYILGLHVKGDWIECHDPYLRRLPKSDFFEPLQPQLAHDPNVRIKRGWLDTKSNGQLFCLGTNSERECVLLLRE